MRDPLLPVEEHPVARGVPNAASVDVAPAGGQAHGAIASRCRSSAEGRELGRHVTASGEREEARSQGA